MESASFELYRMLGVVKEHVRLEQNQEQKGEDTGKATAVVHSIFTPGLCLHCSLHPSF